MNITKAIQKRMAFCLFTHDFLSVRFFQPLTIFPPPINLTRKRDLSNPILTQTRTFAPALAAPLFFKKEYGVRSILYLIWLYHHYNAQFSDSRLSKPNCQW